VTITLPENPADLGKFLASTDAATLTGDDWQEVAAAYAKGFMAKNDDLNRQIEEQVAVGLQNFLKDQREQGATPSRATFHGSATHRQGAAYSPTAPGASLDGIYSSAAEFVQANWHAKGQMIPQARGRELDVLADKAGQIQNSYSSTVPDAGGALIPEEMRSDLLMNVLENSVVRPLATVIPMNSLTLDVPAVDETTHVGSVFGGVVTYWTAEGAAATESQGSFGKVTLENSTLTAYSEAPNQLIADAPAFTGFFNAVMPSALAFGEDLAFLTGNGVGQPLGVQKGTGAIAVTRPTANKVKAADIVSMYTRMLPSSLNSAVWVCSPDVVAQLLQLVMPTGDSTTTFVAPPLWLTNGLIGAPTMSLLGRPLYVTEKVGALGARGDIMFVDFKQYLVGDRQAITMSSSPHFKFSSNKTAFMLTERVDGRPWMASPLTPANGGATLSPYVVLAA